MELPQLQGAPLATPWKLQMSFTPNFPHPEPMRQKAAEEILFAGPSEEQKGSVLL